MGVLIIIFNESSKANSNNVYLSAMKFTFTLPKETTITCTYHVNVHAFTHGVTCIHVHIDSETFLA